MSRSGFRGSIVVAAAMFLVIPMSIQVLGMRPAGATAPGSNGKIAFGRYTEGGIYKISPNGTGIVRLATGAFPSWSPDGSRIAYVRYGGGDGSDAIWTMDAWGGQRREVIPGAFTKATWSPDGSQIAYAVGSSESVIQNLWIANSDGSDPHQLTFSTKVDNFQPAWSPDGTQIAFTLGPIQSAPGDELWLINPDGTGLRQLTFDSGGSFQATWSPDGTQIVFASLRSGNLDLWKMNVDGTGLQQLTHKKAVDWMPCWSPDGKLIAFSSNRSGAYEKIWTIGSNGKGTHQVTWLANTGDHNPDWQPIPQ